MSKQTLVVLAALAASVAVAGCSAEADPSSDDDFASEKPVALKSGSVAMKVPQAFANEVVVEEARLVVPRNATTERVLDRMRSGLVIAGNRDVRSTDLKVSSNPSGFLRKVASLSTLGDKVEIRTTKAYLNELIDEGDLVFSATSPSPSIFEDAPKVSQGLTFAGPSGGSSGSGETSANVVLRGPTANVAFAPVVTIANTKVALGAKLEGRIQLRRALGLPLGIQRASLSLDLDPSIAADIEYGAKATSAQSQLGGTLSETWEGASVPIPIGGPIPLTIRLRPEIECKVTAKGEVTLTSRVTLAGHAMAGFDYRGGSDLRATSQSPRLETEHRLLGVRGKAGIEGECAIQAVVSVLAFDAAGIEVKLGPFAAVTAEVCGTAGPGGVGGGFVVYERHGLRADAQGRLQVPGLGYPSLTTPLFGLKPLQSDPLFFVGTPETCAIR